jgi:hypothetical protein
LSSSRRRFIKGRVRYLDQLTPIQHRDAACKKMKEEEEEEEEGSTPRVDLGTLQFRLKILLARSVSPTQPERG